MGDADVVGLPAGRSPDEAPSSNEGLQGEPARMLDARGEVEGEGAHTGGGGRSCCCGAWPPPPALLPAAGGRWLPAWWCALLRGVSPPPLPPLPSPSSDDRLSLRCAASLSEPCRPAWACGAWWSEGEVPDADKALGQGGWGAAPLCVAALPEALGLVRPRCASSSAVRLALLAGSLQARMSRTCACVCVHTYLYVCVYMYACVRACVCVRALVCVCWCMKTQSVSCQAPANPMWNNCAPKLKAPLPGTKEIDTN